MTDRSSKQYDIELETLRSRVLEMGGLVESQILAAINGVAAGDLRALDHVIAEDHRVNALEVSIDTDCSHLIARRQPTAGDLRMVLAVIKIVTDLERIGDEAAKIARMARSIAEANRHHLPRIEFKHMENTALLMLRRALDAYARLDAVAAAAVVKDDDTVDDEFRAILRQLITHMMEDPRTISRAIDLLFVSKALERIGDHAKNMCEYVVYLVKGRDVRHLAPDEIVEQAARN